MAIVQVSRVTQRKGLETDLPQPLAGAELGWATDTRQLYIGNGELAEGAPVIGNTEILTEFSDILALASSYSYKGEAAGYTVQTGTTTGSPITQSLQRRLDSYCVVTDFGATGDGVTDDSAAINRALNQLYCREANSQARRSLFFPAGNYLITDTIAVPTYAMLYGEGTNSSIIDFQVNPHTAAVAYQVGVLVSNAGSYYRSIAQVPAGISISSTPYWTLSTLPTVVVRTADSLQQTGANITSNGATAPTGIQMIDMKIRTNMPTMNGLLVESCSDSTFTVDIAGPNTTTVNSSISNSTKAIDFASTSSQVCTHILLESCRMSGFTYPVNSAQQLKSVTFNNCYFVNFYQGIYLGGVTPVNGGATGVRMTGNIFDTIYLQGIVIDSVSLNVSAYNVFYDVGNHFNGVGFPASTIIDINLANNLSIGDLFQRTSTDSSTFARIDINNTASIGIDNAVQLQLGTYVRQTGLSRTLLNNQVANVVLFTIGTSTAKAFNFDYTVVRNANIKTGVFTVVSSTDGTGSNLVYNDSGFENQSPGVTLAAAETGGNVSVYYTTTSLVGNVSATLNYSVTKLA